MAGRPAKNSARLRHALSTVYASETRSGSREFHASSAARALYAAVSRVNGGNGGRPCAGAFMRARQKCLVKVRPMVRGVLVTVYGCNPHSGTDATGMPSPGGWKVEHSAYRAI